LCMFVWLIHLVFSSLYLNKLSVPLLIWRLTAFAMKSGFSGIRAINNWI